MSEGKPATLQNLESKGALHPWSQTHTQRLELVSELDQITEQFIQCEHDMGRNCDQRTLKELYLEGVMLVVALKEPKAHYELDRCKSQKSVKTCWNNFVPAYNRWYNLMDRKIADKRKNPGQPKTPKWWVHQSGECTTVVSGLCRNHHHRHQQQQPSDTPPLCLNPTRYLVQFAPLATSPSLTTRLGRWLSPDPGLTQQQGHHHPATAIHQHHQLCQTNSSIVTPLPSSSRSIINSNV